MVQTQKDTAAPQLRQKFLGVPLKKGFERTNKGTLLTRGYFTSDNKDEVGDIITRGATERALPKYRRWRNIRLMHQPIPVGKVTRIGNEDGLEWNEVEIEVIDQNAASMVENGLLQALSVGILVRMNDVEMLEDGGLIINDYDLAEISLVDHPANYDAFLKGVPVEQGLQMVVRQYGFDAIAQSMLKLLEEEIPMNENDIAHEAIENDGADTTALEQEAAPVEVAVAEEVPAAGEAPTDEAPADEIPADEEEPVVEEVPAEEPAAEMPSELAAAIDAINEAVQKATEELTQVIAEFKKALEVEAEAPLAEERAGDGGVLDEATEVPGSGVLAGAPAAVERRGALPETELPGEETAPPAPERSKDLRESLRRYFALRQN